MAAVEQDEEEPGPAAAAAWLSGSAWDVRLQMLRSLVRPGGAEEGSWSTVVAATVGAPPRLQMDGMLRRWAMVSRAATCGACLLIDMLRKCDRLDTEGGAEVGPCSGSSCVHCSSAALGPSWSFPGRSRRRTDRRRKGDMNFLSFWPAVNLPAAVPPSVLQGGWVSRLVGGGWLGEWAAGLDAAPSSMLQVVGLVGWLVDWLVG